MLRSANVAGRFSCFAALVIASLALVAAKSSPARAADDVTLQLKSGRTFSGQVDSQTDRDVLWLRVTHGSIVLLRPIEWSRVVLAWEGDKQLSGAELQRVAQSLKSDRPDTSHRDVPPPPAPLDDPRALPPPPRPALSLNQSAGAVQLTALEVAPSPVVSLDLDAELGHWTPTVETSGFRVRIFPCDASGQIVPISGTLEIDLIGQALAGYDTAADFPLIGRWTLAVSPNDFGPSGAVYQCPFQAVHPDFDTDFRPIGLVHARLAVPGEGVFEASQSLVRIRHYSSIRDRNQQTTGDRFFPIEQTSR